MPCFRLYNMYVTYCSVSVFDLICTFDVMNLTVTLVMQMLQVLWPECGWQPVSLTDLITAASVKKFYRKATLCIHPDKVQQKGANLQQKYIAEKVFDMLKVSDSPFYAPSITAKHNFIIQLGHCVFISFFPMTINRKHGTSSTQKNSFESWDYVL